MTETLEKTLENTESPQIRRSHEPNRLYRALAWVGIAAGSLFIVGSVFLSGFFLGQQSGGGGHHGPHAVMLKPFHGPFHGPGGPMGPPPPGGPMMGPDQGPRAERLTPPSQQPGTPSRPQ